SAPPERGETHAARATLEKPVPTTWPASWPAGERGTGRRPGLGPRHADDGGTRRRDLAHRRSRAHRCVRDGDPTSADRRRLNDERGSAVVEFVLVSVLVVTLLLGVLQLTLALHVRNTVVDAAGEGARY